jgi:hypothetical protein
MGHTRAIGIVTILFRNMELAVSKGPACHAARRLTSLRHPMPLIAWREELQEMAVGLCSANPLAPQRLASTGTYF